MTSVPKVQQSLSTYRRSGGASPNVAYRLTRPWHMGFSPRPSSVVNTDCRISPRSFATFVHHLAVRPVSFLATYVQVENSIRYIFQRKKRYIYMKKENLQYLPGAVHFQDFSCCGCDDGTGVIEPTYDVLHVDCHQPLVIGENRKGRGVSDGCIRGKLSKPLARAQIMSCAVEPCLAVLHS